MTKTYKICKGLDIRLKGEAEKDIKTFISPNRYIIIPDNFTGITPKLKIKEGDSVKRGETLFFDKNKPEIVAVSPVCGSVTNINRGEKRKIKEIIITPAQNDEVVKYDLSSFSIDSKDAIIDLLLSTGVWNYIKQRPYGIIASPQDTPRDIFISFFDSSPLAADFDFILKDKKDDINIALKALSKLVGTKIYLNFKKETTTVDLIENRDKYNINYFEGKYPAGLVGTQINKIKPVNKGEIIWTINAVDLPIIGHAIRTGEFFPERLIALAGSEIKNTGYFKILSGADISSIITNNTNSDNYRIISGNVLTGENISENPALGYYDTMLTVIPEGNKYEMFGWALPGLHKFSNSRTFLSLLFSKKRFEINTNYHGGKRAFVVTGEYEKVCPLDIYPQLLVKAAITEDIDKMEELGIYEVIEEDVALWEFVCTSKIEVQTIIRNGLKLIRKEMS